MGTVNPKATLASLVLDEPDRAALFERLGFDYCCRGGRPLAEACSERDLDVDTVVRLLEAHTASRAPTTDEEHDWRRLSTAELCDHIVTAHHEPLRSELPRLAETLETVVSVHGPRDSRLDEVSRLFGDLSRELLEHLEREEQVLFPGCRTLEASGAVDREALLGELEEDHAGVGETLATLRELTGGFDREAALCGTHRALLDGLHALERDLHQHIHEENNVLFPRIRSRLAAA